MEAVRAADVGHPCHPPKGLAGGGYERTGLLARRAGGEGKSKVRRGRGRGIVLSGGAHPVFEGFFCGGVKVKEVNLGTQRYVEDLPRP